MQQSQQRFLTREVLFDIGFPEEADLEEETRLCFRANLRELLLHIGNDIASGNSNHLGPGKETKHQIEFPITIRLSIEQEFRDIKLTAEVFDVGKWLDEDTVDATPEVNVLPEPDYSYMDCIEWR